MINLISILYRKAQIYLNENLSKLSITMGQAPFILCICQNEGISQNKLAYIFEMDKSTIAKMAAKLQADGYILKKQNSTDNRIINLYPTEKSKIIYPEIIKIMKNLYLEITNGFTEVEITIFDALMKRAIKNITEYFNKVY